MSKVARASKKTKNTAPKLTHVADDPAVTHVAVGPTHTAPSAPSTLTEDQEEQILGRFRFTGEDVSYYRQKVKGVLDSVPDELAGLTEGVTATLHDNEFGDGCGEILAAFALQLAAVSARMMRYAGRLEATEEALSHARKTDEMLESYRAGALGPFISRAERRAARAGTVQP